MKLFKRFIGYIKYRLAMKVCDYKIIIPDRHLDSVFLQGLNRQMLYDCQKVRDTRHLRDIYQFTALVNHVPISYSFYWTDAMQTRHPRLRELYLQSAENKFKQMILKQLVYEIQHSYDYTRTFSV